MRERIEQEHDASDNYSLLYTLPSYNLLLNYINLKNVPIVYGGDLDAAKYIDASARLMPQ